MFKMFDSSSIHKSGAKLKRKGQMTKGKVAKILTFNILPLQLSLPEHQRHNPFVLVEHSHTREMFHIFRLWAICISISG